MNENAKKWIGALESGEWNQCKKKLCDGKGCCCLGVACELYCREHDDLSVVFKYGFCYYGGTCTELPIKVQQWLGIKSRSGCFKNTSLVNLNDSGYSFAKIAEIIKENEEHIFVEL